MDTVIIIPARGGSKRVKRKNLMPVGQKPLLAYTFDLVKSLGLTDNTYVSTEDAEIKYFAEQYGMNVIHRPQELASDSSSTEEALIDALDQLAKNGIEPEWICTLEPTSPFRRTETLKKFFEKQKNLPHDVDCLFATIKHTSYFWRKDDNDVATPLFAEAPRRSQLRDKQGFSLFKEAGGVFISKVASLRKHMEKGSIAPIFGAKAVTLPIDSIEAFDIDTKADMILAETLVQSGNARTSALPTNH